MDGNSTQKYRLLYIIKFSLCFHRGGMVMMKIKQL